MLIDGKTYQWKLKVNQTLLGRESLINFNFNENIICVSAVASNKTNRNVAGYIQPIVTISIGQAVIGANYKLIDNQMRLLILPKIQPYKLKFYLGAPIGNCKIKIWEGEILEL